MNSDRLTQMSSDIIVAGLTTKWTNAYYFLKFVFSSTDTNNGISFNSLNSSQFALDLAYYLEPEDIYFLMFQSTDKLIQVSNGISTIQLTIDNLKQILIHKWKRSITQLNSVLESIEIENDYLSVSFRINENVEKKYSQIESEVYKIRVILSNYLENYMTEVSNNALHPIISVENKINWDTIKSRFSYRMGLNWGNCLSLGKDSGKIMVGDRFCIKPYINGIPTYGLSFVSSNIAVATVNSGGLITAIKEGVATITITDTQYNLTKEFYIYVNSNRLNINASLIYLYPNNTKKLTSYLNNKKITNVSYSTSNPNIATVDLNGIVSSGTEFGTCIINISDIVHNVSGNVTVRSIDNLFGLNTSEILLEEDATFKINATLNEKPTTDVTYSVSDSSVATVNENGIIYGIKRNCMCTVTVVCNKTGLFSSIKVSVVRKALAVTAGNLLALIGSEKLTVDKLVLIGTLKSADIICLRDMMINGMLSSLDLEYVNILQDNVIYYDGNAIPNDNVIGQAMFKNCTKLTNLVLPRACTNIGADSISNNPNLLSVKIFENVSKIEQWALASNPKINSIVMEDGLIPLTIDKSVFSYNTVLPLLNFPSRLITISGSILDWSDNCYNITLNSVTPPIASGWFGGNIQKIYVPAQSVNVYKSTNVWSSYNIYAII